MSSTTLARLDSGTGTTRVAARNLGYAAVCAPLYIAHLPTVSILPALYAQQAQLSLVAIGTILVAMRVLDAVIDPAIGYLSDATRSRLGPRKPWMIAGALLCSLGVWIAFNPSPSSGYLHFAIGYFLLVVGYSMVEIPHMALVSDLTGDYDQRARLATYRYVGRVLGSLSFVAIPLIGVFPTTAMTAQVTSLAAWLVIGLFAVTLPLLLAVVPNTAAAVKEGDSPKVALRDLARNRPFLQFVAMYGAAGLASGLVSGLFFFYLGSYLAIADKYSHIMLGVYAISAFAALFWLKVTLHWDKHLVLAACALATAACNVAMFFIRPGDAASLLMVVVFGVTAFAVAGQMGAITALVADVADYGRYQSRRDHAGNYFATAVFINKCCEAVGGGLGLVIAGLFGFSVKGPNGAWAMAGFFLAIIWIPFALNSVAALIAWRFPITRRRQAAIRRRLERRSS